MFPISITGRLICGGQEGVTQGRFEKVLAFVYIFFGIAIILLADDFLGLWPALFAFCVLVALNSVL